MRIGPTVKQSDNAYLSLEERRLSRDLRALHDMQLFNTSHVFSFSSKGSQHLQHVAFIAYFHNSLLLCITWTLTSSWTWI